MVEGVLREKQDRLVLSPFGVSETLSLLCWGGAVGLLFVCPDVSAQICLGQDGSFGHSTCVWYCMFLTEASSTHPVCLGSSEPSLYPLFQVPVGTSARSHRRLCVWLGERKRH